MAMMTDEKLKNIFPELFMDNECENEGEKKALLRLRETIRTRFDMDKAELIERSKERKFTENETYLYGAILSSNTDQAVKTGLLQAQVDVLQEDMNRLKQHTSLPSSDITAVTAKGNAKPYLKKTIKK